MLSSSATKDVRKIELLMNVIQDLSSFRTMEEIMTLVRSATRALVGSDGATYILKDGDLTYYADEDAIEPLSFGKGVDFPSIIVFRAGLF